jgi:hypothetical protein
LKFTGKYRPQLDRAWLSVRGDATEDVLCKMGVYGGVDKGFPNVLRRTAESPNSSFVPTVIIAINIWLRTV